MNLMMGIGIGIGSQQAVVSGGGGGASSSKFNSAALYDAADWSLSSDKLTATRIATTSAIAIAYVDTAKTSGKCQFTMGNMQTGGSTQGSGAGLADGTNHATVLLGFGNGVAYYHTGGIFAQGALLDASTPYTNGDVIDIDYSDGLNVIFKKNGTTVFTVNLASAGVSNTLIPAACNGNNASETGQTFLYNPVAW